MAPETAPKPIKAGLSLYANLLDPSSTASAASGTISRAPVVFKQPPGVDSQDEASAQKQQLSAASLRFQPTKRPQLAAQKPKSKAPLPKSTPPAIQQIGAVPDAPSTVSRLAAKSTLADWTAGDDDDVNGFYGGEKRQRGGRKKRKKNKEESHVPQNWDDIYDPSRPNSYEEYKHSDEKIREVREWKDRLYAHRMARRRSSYSDSEDESRPRPQINNQFAPLSMSFAPPPNLNEAPVTQVHAQPATVPNDPTGDDAYARRLRLSQMQNPDRPSYQPSTTFPPTAHQTSPPPPPPPPASEPSFPSQPPPPPPSISDQPPPPTISRAPVRYNLPPPPSDIPKSEAELESVLQQEEEEEEEEDNGPADSAPRSLRPGQKGFAERLMSKYGWTKGSGLGASGSGIVNPLRVQVEKQKKKPDSEGGGFVGPGGRGKIIGGKRKGGMDAKAEVGKFGAMSEVVVLRGMVDGMDLDAELEGAGDGGLMQEIGEECGEKYGRVERVFIDRSSPATVSAPVFVKFTSQLSALRAVNALEGRIFNGNTITARFFDTDTFERGVYV
ncbi:hypothetical protein MMC24_007896 [Lignoscripta atroalba]|nr:hypothetical protein [Lignoscripta atroalba]